MTSTDDINEEDLDAEEADDFDMRNPMPEPDKLFCMLPGYTSNRFPSVRTPPKPSSPPLPFFSLELLLIKPEVVRILRIVVLFPVLFRATGL